MSDQLPTPDSFSHNFEIFACLNGDHTLRHSRSGECMHSKIGPWAEANLLYVDQSDLKARLSSREPKPLVVFDVGLGLAANALAAVEYRSHLCPSYRSLRVISFENDLEGLRFALNNAQLFPFLRIHLAAVRTLLSQGKWVSPDESIIWELREGDFIENLSTAPAPDLIYYDFYAPKSCPELWSPEIFKILHNSCVKSTLLLTYSASKSVRMSLALAGFWIGEGVSTPTKRETTLASVERDFLKSPLALPWLESLERSDRAVPSGWSTDSRRRAIALLKRCLQFRGMDV